MKVLVVGSGGREHALARALTDSPGDVTTRVVPGNGGTGSPADGEAANSVEDLVDRARREDVDLCVVGPEAYLEKGLANACREAGIPCWGPRDSSARLETSKSTAKDFMNRHGVPTGDYRLAESPDELRDLVAEYPTVLKYDGLAGGKGVSIPEGPEDVEAYIREVYEEKRFGSIEPVLVEELLEGVELTVIAAVADGEYQLFPPARDYKPLRDGDEGPNTGGMGAVASREVVDPAMMDRIEEEIVQPTIRGLEADDMPYRGFLYFGLMLTEEGPKILEYNCRFGDPEAQAILPLLEGDFAAYLDEASRGRLDPSHVSFREGWSVCLMAASEGYPYDSGDGETIHGLDAVEGGRVYHSGTRRAEDGSVEAVGGRVLSTVGTAEGLSEARRRAYEAMDRIHFEGMHHRSDVARLHFEETVS